MSGDPPWGRAVVWLSGALSQVSLQGHTRDHTVASSTSCTCAAAVARRLGRGVGRWRVEKPRAEEKKEMVESIMVIYNIVAA